MAYAAHEVDGENGVKRNKELILELLGFWINGEEIQSLSSKELLKLTEDNALGPYELEQINYHVRLMNDIGLIEHAFTGGGDTIKRVTWDGYDYYEAGIKVLRVAK